MHKVLVLYPPPTDPAAFEEHYRTVHLPLARKLPGMLACRFTLSVDAGDRPSPYFAIFEADFPDEETYAAAMASPEGQAVGADVPNYATGGAVVLHYDVES
ncbi:EthD family reductase [Georgenia deserti]|uniref:EthD family reductase n=1 Tax=Georgenia deserti TaxID=2093781 RepID=A0ABW4L4M2_9MICO